MVIFKNVLYQIPNGEVIYHDLDVKIGDGEFYGVLGKNGAGKSTLIEIIMGLRKISSGKVVVFGENPESNYRTQKHRIFVVTHDMMVPSNITIGKLLDYYAFFYPNYDREIEKELLDLFEINPKKKFGTLSTGQKIKALLCAAFAARCELYLMDEVTAVLDPKSRRNFFKYLKVFREKHQCSLLLATNIAEDLYQSVDHVIFIDSSHKVIVTEVEKLDSLFELDDVESVA